MMLQQEMMTLWQNCFGDDPDFIRTYFQEKFREENAVTARDGSGRLVAALQMLPYTLSFGGCQLPVSYISGACTREEFRGKGVMKALFLRAFARMRRRGVPLSVLIPQESWLFEYYARMGYAPVFDYSWWSPPGENFPLPSGWSVRECVTAEGAAELFSLFNLLMKQRDICIQHDRDDFRAVCADLFAAGGCLLVLVADSGEDVGIACVLPEETGVRVMEALFVRESQRLLLAGEIGRRWPEKQQRWRVMPADDSVSYGMARLVDVERVLQVVAESHPEIVCSLYVSDPLAVRNTGWFTLDGGRVRRTVYPFYDPAFRVTVAQLTQLVLGYHPDRVLPGGALFPAKSPFMNLMLD